MGSSFSCICDPSSTVDKQVPDIKEDGELLKFKEVIPVKDILLAYPYRKVIRCSSDKTVLPESFQLSCNQLYFLLPRGPALDDETYDSLLKLAASRNPKSTVVCSGRNDNNLPGKMAQKPAWRGIRTSQPRIRMIQGTLCRCGSRPCKPYRTQIRPQPCIPQWNNQVVL